MFDWVHIMTTEVPPSPIILSLHHGDLPISTIPSKIAFLCISSFLETDACTPRVRSLQRICIVLCIMGCLCKHANVKSVSTLFARRVPWYCVCTGPVLDLMRVDQTRWAAECRWRATEPLTIKTERHPPTCVCVQFQFHSASQKNKPKRMVYHSNEIWFSDRCSLVRFQRNPGTITISQPAGQYQYHIRFLWKPRNW